MDLGEREVVLRQSQNPEGKILNAIVSANANNEDNDKRLPFNESLPCMCQVFYIYYFALSIHQLGI